MTPIQGWIVIVILAFAVRLLYRLCVQAVWTAQNIVAINESLNQITRNLEKDRDEIRNSLHAIETDTHNISRR